MSEQNETKPKKKQQKLVGHSTSGRSFVNATEKAVVKAAMRVYKWEKQSTLYFRGEQVIGLGPYGELLKVCARHAKKGKP